MSVRANETDRETRARAAAPAPRGTLRRDVEVLEVRAIDVEARTATFVATTERGVETGWGAPEVLRMSGVQLKRFKKNPVLLDSHNRWSLESVIGSAEVSVEGRRLLATCTYAETPKGENAWSLVRDGHVRAMSIGYQVDLKSIKQIREGEHDGEGDGRVEGPAVIVKKWQLLEVSNVPVPADEDAVRRSFYDELGPAPRTEGSMGLKKGAKPAKAAPVRAENEDEVEGAEGENAGAAETTEETTEAPPVPARPELPEERAARVREAHRREVLAITPRGLEAEAEASILDGDDLTKTRERLKKAQASRFKPVGTPDPLDPKPEEGAAGGRAAQLPEDVTDDVLVRSFQNLKQ